MAILSGVVIGALLGSARPSAAVDIHIVRPNGGDVNGDRIDARLEWAINHSNFVVMPNAVMQGGSAIAVNKGQTASSTVVDLIVCMDHAPTAADVAQFTSRGFQVKQTYSHLIYALHLIGPLPNGVQTLRDLVSAIPSISYIQPDNRVYAYLIHSTRQIGARQSWTTYQEYNSGYPLRGAPNRSIAVLDTGIDGTSPDISSFDSTYHTTGSKIIGWDDFVNQTPAPEDPFGHGSHVSGIAAGTGVEGGIANGTGYIDLITSPSGIDLPINVTGFTSPPTLGIDGYFGNSLTDVSGDTTNTYTLVNWTDNLTSSSDVLASGVSANGEQPIPISLSVPLTTQTTTTETVPTNLDYYLNFTSASTSQSILADGDPLDFAAVSSVPETAIGDGYNLVTGVAPESSLVGVRVLDSSGSGSEDMILSGLDYVSANAARYNIGVVNMSIGVPDIESDLDKAVDNLVAQGVVCVIAAGNNRPTFENFPGVAYTGGIGSPGSATDAITVAALGPVNEEAVYSSYGSATTQAYSFTLDSIPFSFSFPPQLKPDVAAPGGSYNEGAFIDPTTGIATHDETIQSVHSNYSTTYDSGQVIPSIAQDAYTDEQGTSMATPHVAGSVALIEQAMDLPGALQGTTKTGEDEALFIKALLEMTATGINLGPVQYTSSTVVNQDADGAPYPADPLHGTQDLTEGYGKINTDAALSAVINTYVPGQTVTYTLGTTSPSTLPEQFAPQCWAENVALTANTTYTFVVTEPAATSLTLKSGTTTTTTSEQDYDFYLYSEAYGTDSSTSNGNSGTPIIVASSTGGPSATQTITYTPTTSGIYFLVVKRINNNGAFTLTTTAPAPPTLISTNIVPENSSGSLLTGVAVAETSSGAYITSGATSSSADGFINLQVPSTATQVVISSPGFYTQTFPLTPENSYNYFTLTPSKTFDTGLQMICVPGMATSIPADTSPKVYIDAVWDGSDEQYDVPPALDTLTFQPGKAYWVRFRQSTSLTIPPTSVGTSSYPISLSEGWNMVGSPYANPGDLSAATYTIGSGPSAVTESYASAANNGVVSGFFAYDQSTNSYTSPQISGSLNAYEGYWIYSASAATLNLTGS